MFEPIGPFEFTKQPALVSLSGNKMVVKAYYRDIYDVAFEGQTYENIPVPSGYALAFHLSYNTDPQVGDTITINATGWSLSKILNCAASVNEEFPFYQFPVKAPGETKTEYLQKLALLFNRNMLTPLYFYFEYGYNGGTEGIFVYGYEGNTIKIVSTGNIISTIAKAASDTKDCTIYDFDLYLLESYDLDGVTSRKVLSQLKITSTIEDPDAYVETDICESFVNEALGHFNLFASDEYFDLHDLAIKYQVMAYNNWGAGLTDEFYVLQGKMPDYFEAELNELSKTWYQYWQVENKKFLTFAPTTKYTDIYSPEKLYYLNKPNIAGSIMFKIYYTDGTNETVERAITYSESELENQVIELNVSFLALPFNVAKSVSKYDVWLINSSDEVISETRYFIMSYQYQPYARYFLYKNKLGSYEVVRTTGKIEAVADIDKSFINVDKIIDYTTDYRAEKQISVERSYPMSLNSGFFNDPLWATYFLEFLESEDVYWLKKGKAFPVIINKGKVKLRTDGEYLQNKPFTLSVTNPDDELYNDFTFDPEVPISGDFNFDFNEDYL